jgi:hypothetical protein
VSADQDPTDPGVDDMSDSMDIDGDTRAMPAAVLPVVARVTPAATALPSTVRDA